MDTQKLLNSWFGWYIDDAQPGLYFRYDVIPEQTAKENWTTYCEMQEELRELGFELTEVEIEHDCISGEVKPINQT